MYANFVFPVHCSHSQPSALGVTIEGGVRDEPVRFSIDSSKTTVEEVLTVERYWNPDYL
jgi:hypothetical protein